jgi:hypothetical protein
LQARDAGQPQRLEIHPMAALILQQNVCGLEIARITFIAGTRSGSIKFSDVTFLDDFYACNFFNQSGMQSAMRLRGMCGASLVRSRSMMGCARGFHFSFFGPGLELALFGTAAVWFSATAGMAATTPSRQRPAVPFQFAPWLPVNSANRGDY